MPGNGPVRSASTMIHRYSPLLPSKNGGNRWVRTKYPCARRILITADGGGSNGHRPWLWKFELVRLAAATGLDIVVRHYPPGTSKTYQTVVNLIANTTTTTGLTVQCELDPNLYPTKIKLTNQQKKTIPFSRHDFHGDWNYTIMSCID